MLKQFLVILIFVCANLLAKGQLAKNSTLFLELKKQDSVFFERSFNLCDIEYLEQTIHQDLLFFHDQSGIQNKADFLIAVKQNICSTPHQKPIRKLEENSLEVFPLYNDGILYGAIESGIHHFYIRALNKKDTPTSTAKFTMVWLLDKEKWLLKEVLSYDHHDPDNSDLKTNFESEIKQLLINEKVPVLGLSIVENGQLKHIDVFGNIDKNTPAAYNSIFKVASLTKPVTALITLKLINAGKLGLDESLNKYWIDPDLKNDIRTKKITPRIILSHQTGFPNWRYLTESKKLSFEFDPGTQFQYSGEGFEYLRKALEAKFNKTLEELATEYVFKPAKMKDTHFWWDKSMDEKRYVKNYDQDGKLIDTSKYYEANAAANLLTTVEDYGNFLAYILNGAGLSSQVLEEMHKNQVQLNTNDFFSLGWEKLTNFSNDEYALIHTGKDPGVNTIAVLFPKSKNAWLIFMNGDNDTKIVEKLLMEKMYLGKELWNKR
ncbi:MAG: class A beta-lactamase-related serine hydrolase [Saprospiraceae bacterium]|nr:class A beta-lactamase-related serine hydrolase [Candidatus Defluviibacterium haderslevense]